MHDIHEIFITVCPNFVQNGSNSTERATHLSSVHLKVGHIEKGLFDGLSKDRKVHTLRKQQVTVTCGNILKRYPKL